MNRHGWAILLILATIANSVSIIVHMLNDKVHLP